MSPLKASEAQLFYANLLNRLTLFSFALLIIAFAIYLSGILSSYVPMQDIIQLWTESSHHYMQTANIKPGWDWVGKVGYGDFLVYVPIVILAGVTIVCYIGVIFKFLKSREYILVVIASLEVLVLLAAASGVLKSGGH
jgi:hypothetical protein|uniref:DUF1634 domain-containing protein n=1 Tax=Desulfobacca acetoxidans TaxID=60893 RepID=A0A7V6A358_9BACT